MLPRHRIQAKILLTSPGHLMALPAANYRFGPFELRTRTRELYKQGIKLKLRPQPLQILKALVERGGDIVTREELRDLLWAKETFVDFEHGLNSSIGELRGVLNDSASEIRYIETLPKFGYRIVVPVEVDEPAPPRATIPEQPARDEMSPGSSPQASRYLRPAVVAGLTLALVASLGTYLRWSRSRARIDASAGRAMLAVLPFENLTGDAAQEYFSDGLTQEMIGQLGRLDPQHLGVIARTSVMHYKHTQEPLPQIGQELGVQYVLEGSVRRDADKVRVSAQLIQLKDQTHVWSRQYDRGIGGLLALQGEIAQEIADEIGSTLGGSPKLASTHSKPSVPSGSYEAYDLYLRGRYFWNKRTAEGFRQAEDYFQQAISKDPNYARAYAGLADTFGLMSAWFLAPQNETMPKARAAALKALQIDEGLAEAHTSLALVAENYDYDWQTAEKEFRRAIQLNPSYATGHQWYAECLSWQGRFDEALAESERARLLDPLSAIIATDHAAILYYSRQYDRAIAESLAVLDMDKSFPRVSTFLLGSYVQEGRFAEAIDLIERTQASPDNPWLWALRAYVYGRWGRTAEAQHAAAKVEQHIPELKLSATPALLSVYISTGRKEDAIALLQKAYAEHSHILVTLEVDPFFDPLRSDPRFQELQRRVGLAQ